LFILRVFVSTWNIGGIAPDEGLNIEDLLETCSKSFDIFVFGYVLHSFLIFYHGNELRFF
jgi:hypothetical protein